MADAFIKIHRKMLEWEWYQDSNTFRLFLHCLLIANWKEGRFMGEVIPRGSFVSSYSQLALQANMSVQSVRTAINHLKSTGELTVKPHAKFSVFTVVNYCQYQDDNRQTNKQLTNSQQATNKQLTTIEEKKEKKEKKELKNNTPYNPPKYYPNDEELNKTFEKYIAMRKKIKKPMTDDAIELAIGKLKKLSGGDSELSIKILEQSIFHSWQGLFELKEDFTKQSKPQSLAEKWGVTDDD